MVSSSGCNQLPVHARPSFRKCGVSRPQPPKRMKNVELICELMVAADKQDVAHKKAVLDTVMKKDSIKGRSLDKAGKAAVAGLNRLRRMFPKLSPAVRLHKQSDFYTLAVLVQRFETEGLVLTDKRRNELAWDLLVAFSIGVDQLSTSSKKLEFKKLEPGEELCREYLQTVREGVDSLTNRRKREQMLRGL